MAVILETSIGQLVVDLYTSERPRCEFTCLWHNRKLFTNHCLVGSRYHHVIEKSTYYFQIVMDLYW